MTEGIITKPGCSGAMTTGYSRLTDLLKPLYTEEVKNQWPMIVDGLLAYDLTASKEDVEDFYDRGLQALRSE